MPIATASPTRKPPPSPYGSIPRIEPALKSTHWIPAMMNEIGTASRPIPRKSNGRDVYIRQDAVRVWPQERRRATRSGAVGRQGVRVRT